MKFLIFASACLASALADPQGFYGLHANHDGTITPLDEPRVAAAKAEHLHTKYNELVHKYGNLDFGFNGFAHYNNFGYGYVPTFASAVHHDVHYDYAPSISYAPATVSYAPATVSYAPAVAPAVIPARVAVPEPTVVAAPVQPAVVSAPVPAVPQRAPEPFVAPRPQPARVATPAPFKPAPAPLKPVVASAPAFNIPTSSTSNANALSSEPIVDAEYAAHAAARAEYLALSAGGLYAQEYSHDPNAGLVRHANGALTPPEPLANLEARRRLAAASRRA